MGVGQKERVDEVGISPQHVLDLLTWVFRLTETRTQGKTSEDIWSELYTLIGISERTLLGYAARTSRQFSDEEAATLNKAGQVLNARIQTLIG